MIIQNRIVQTFDVEVFPNVFSCTILNSETKDIKVFEISHRTDDVIKEATEMCNFFLNKDYLFCGYNCIHYDNIIINFFITHLNSIPNDFNAICYRIHKLSDSIINSIYDESLKKLKYANYFKTLDLMTMLFSSKLRVGLKEIQVTMGYENVQEYSGSFDDFLYNEQIDEMLKYNLNDVKSTDYLLNLCKKDIELRIDIEKEFGIDVLSMDGMTIGTEILKVEYLKKTGYSWWDIKDLRSPCDYINLNKIILPFIKYDTPILQDVLSEMKQQVVSPGRKGYEKKFLLDGVEVTVGVGGIHTRNDPEIIKPKENELLLDSDVVSLYPSLIIVYNIVPKHLGQAFLDVYSQIREDRIKAKRNKETTKNETLKLALNGATGNYQNEFSWLYDPEAVMRIRINGQLLLLMLAEKLIQVGAKITQLNTDGILYTIPKNVDYKEVLGAWENITRLELETEEFETFYQFAVNDYLAVEKGYKETKDKILLKQKGLFIEETNIGKGMSPPIIAKAINKYFADNVPIEETIHSSRNIKDFLTYQKADKKFSVEYDKKLISRINRYYASTDGSYIFKCEVNNEIRYNYIHMLKSSGVTIVNDFAEIKTFPDNINYNYYIMECNKIIQALTRQQLNFFNLFES